MLDYLDKKSQFNPLDDIRYWIRSIHAHISSSQEDDDEVKPFQRVLLVGTHRGDSTRLREIDDYIHEELIMKKGSKNYVNHIRSTGREMKHFIPVENSIDHNQCESYRQRSGIEDLQLLLEESKRFLPFLDEQFPIKWLKFGEHLNRLKHTHAVEESAPIVNVDELKKMAVECGIVEEKQQDLALKFFHFAGKITYLSKSLIVTVR